jgi:hypothetical protein
MNLIVDCSRCGTGMTPLNGMESDWLQRLSIGSGRVRLNTITPENIDEWLFRFRFLERLWPHTGMSRMPIAGIARWIGLRTNVRPVRRPEWVSEFAEIAAMDVALNVQFELLDA